MSEHIAQYRVFKLKVCFSFFYGICCFFCFWAFLFSLVSFVQFDSGFNISLTKVCISSVRQLIWNVFMMWLQSMYRVDILPSWIWCYHSLQGNTSTADIGELNFSCRGTQKYRSAGGCWAYQMQYEQQKGVTVADLDSIKYKIIIIHVPRRKLIQNKYVDDISMHKCRN